MKIAKINEHVFKELGKEKNLILYHNIIYNLTGVVIDFINSDNNAMSILPIEHLNPYCKLMRCSPQRIKLCNECDSLHLGRAKRTKNEQLYLCDLGLYEIILPLFDSHDNYIGAMATGQFLLEGQKSLTYGEVEKLSKGLNFDATELYKLYKASPCLTQKQLDGLYQFLRHIGELIIENSTNILFWEKTNVTTHTKMMTDFIQENYHKHLTVQMIAEKFFLAPNYFSRIFKKNVGVTFVEYLNMFRVRKAEDLLQKSGLGVVEIGFLCGFGSASQFYRVFKSARGLSPKEYAKKQLKLIKSTK